MQYTRYFGEADLPPTLTREEERKLLENMRSGCKDSRNMLIERNLRLVIHKAMQWQGNGMETEALIDQALEGLVYAVDHYDETRDAKLSTFISLCSEQKIISGLRNMRAAKRTGVVVSLDMQIGRDDGYRQGTLEEMIGEACGIDEALDEEADRQLVKTALEAINENERRVLEALYGLNGRARMKQTAAAQALGMSQPHVCRLEKKALRKMRAVIESLQREEMGA